MTPQEKILFREKQYLGRNAYWLNRRLVLIVFCFVAYFLTKNNKQDSDLFLLVGTAIIVISIALTFVTHFSSTLYENCVVLDGLWSTSRVKIDLKSIVSVEKSEYSSFLLNNPVYNLHKKGTIRFYTRGKEAIKLIDRDGLVYMIGSQRAEEFANLVKKQLENNK